MEEPKGLPQSPTQQGRAIEDVALPSLSAQRDARNEGVPIPGFALAVVPGSLRLPRMAGEDPGVPVGV